MLADMGLRGHRSIGRRGFAGVILAAGLAVACSSPPPVVIDQGHAASIANTFVVAAQAAGTAIDQVVIGIPQDVGSAWRVQVDAVVIDRNHPASRPVPVHYLVDVDQASGQARIFAQG